MWGPAPRHSRVLAAITGLIALLFMMPFSAGAQVAVAATVTGVNPMSGPVGSTVTITGTNFVNVSNVTFYDTPSPSWKLNSTTSITAIVPAGTPSPGRWRVVNTAYTAVYDPTFTVSSTPPIPPAPPTRRPVASPTP